MRRGDVSILVARHRKASPTLQISGSAIATNSLFTRARLRMSSRPRESRLGKAMANEPDNFELGLGRESRKRGYGRGRAWERAVQRREVLHWTRA